MPRRCWWPPSIALETEWIEARDAANDPSIEADDEEGLRRDLATDAIALRMSEIPARTVAGVSVKLRWLHDFQLVHQNYVSPIEQCQEVCVRGALADLARIGGGS